MEPFKIEFENRTYVFDVSAVSANEWKAVRNYCGHNPFALFDAIGRSEIEAIEAAFWLTMRQNHEPAFDFGQRQFGLLAFLEGWNKANDEAAARAKDEEKAKAAEDTGPKGQQTLDTASGFVETSGS